MSVRFKVEVGSQKHTHFRESWQIADEGKNNKGLKKPVYSN